MNPISFRASAYKAFRQSTLKARGLLLGTNYTEEAQAFWAEITSPVSVHQFDKGARPTDPSPAIEAVVNGDFNAWPQQEYAGAEVPPIWLNYSNARDLNAYRHLSPSVALNLPQGSALLENKDIGNPPTDFPNRVYGLWPLLPQAADYPNHVFEVAIQRSYPMQMSYWLYSSNGAGSDGEFQTNMIHAQKVRFRINTQQSGFMIMVDFWVASYPLGGPSIDTTKIAYGWQVNYDPVAGRWSPQAPFCVTLAIRNIRLFSEFTAVPYEYVHVPFPTTRTYGSPWIDGFVGSGILAIYGETIDQWTARLGYTLS